ncbi:MAG: hypothetical protein ACTS3F_08960 [Phycisphaerales bacterium]
MPDPPTMRWVLHRHTPPDGPSHLDWMIGAWPGLADNGLPDARILRSWRIQVDPTMALRFAGEAAPDHRRAYLDFRERELSDGRGRITREAHGTAILVADGGARFTLMIQRDDPPSPAHAAPTTLMAAPDPHRPGWWVFQRADPSNHPPDRDPAH